MHHGRKVWVALALAGALLAGGAQAAAAQGKGHGKGGKSGQVPPGHAKKRVTTDDAIIVTREVLVSHGFTVVRVERVEGAQVVYYRAGNKGRGRGWGPVQKMVLRPAR
ncbi:MAG TPA: hypothetical protein VFS05_14205, partial [Gemmatimonadaceae bacterium]|nr:hypothetical protein [Gemmatimonadaceae bacterium]